MRSNMHAVSQNNGMLIFLGGLTLRGSSDGDQVWLRLHGYRPLHQPDPECKIFLVSVHSSHGNYLQGVQWMQLLFVSSLSFPSLPFLSFAFAPCFPPFHTFTALICFDIMNKLITMQADDYILQSTASFKDIQSTSCFSVQSWCIPSEKQLSG